MKKHNEFNIPVFNCSCALVLLCFCVLVLSACTNPAPTDFKTISINKHQIQVELADTPQKRSQGLSDRQSIPADQGMLFIFDDYSQPGFWMKDMHFPLDIVWLEDYTIIKIDKNVPLENNQNLTVYKPSQPINAVLELNAGYIDEKNIKIGDRVEIII